MKNPVLLSVAGFLSRVVRSRKQIEKLTSLRVLGEVPHVYGTRELLVTDRGHFPVGDSYRLLREQFPYSFLAESRRVLGIHSVEQDEGKSFTAVNLGRTLASDGKGVLLISANMRRSRLHQFLGVKNECGLSTYLTGGCGIDAVIQKTVIEGLEVVTSGAVPPNPAELLGNELFRMLINRGRKSYDYVIIDNAPVSVFTDALITSRLADLNLFVLRHGLSRKRHLRLIRKLVTRGMMDHLALLINDVRP